MTIKSDVDLKIDGNGAAIQAMPCKEGGEGKTSSDGTISVYKEYGLIECIEDGDFTVTYRSGGTGDYTRVAGMVKSLTGVESLVINNGTFDLA